MRVRSSARGGGGSSTLHRWARLRRSKEGVATSFRVATSAEYRRARNEADRAIAKSKDTTFARFLYGLGIANVGETTASALAQNFAGLEELLEADEDRLQQIPDVGPVVAAALRSFFHEEHNRSVIAALQEAGVRWPLPTRRKAEGQPLAGRTFVITGTLHSMTREEAKSRLQALGAKVSGSVSKKTAALIVGSEPGTKLQAAESLGVEVWSEDRLRSLLGEN
jgi:DNA ligase (NAD+)